MRGVWPPEKDNRSRFSLSDSHFSSGETKRGFDNSKNSMHAGKRGGQFPLILQRLRLTALEQGRLRSRLTARPTFTAPEFFRGRCADACASRSTFTCGLRARRQPPRTRTRSERGQTASFHPNGGSLLDQAATLRGATPAAAGAAALGGPGGHPPVRPVCGQSVKAVSAEKREQLSQI